LKNQLKKATFFIFYILMQYLIYLFLVEAAVVEATVATSNQQTCNLQLTTLWSECSLYQRTQTHIPHWLAFPGWSIRLAKSSEFLEASKSVSQSQSQTLSVPQEESVGSVKNV